MPPWSEINAYDATVVLSACHTIGWHGEMTVLESGEEIRKLSVIVVDCAGADAYQDGVSWMERYGFAAEMGYPLWQENPSWYLNPDIEARITVWPRHETVVNTLTPCQ